MVTYKEKQLFFDDKPVFILSGEIHYFRQPKENWQHLLDTAKDTGLNCIASYVPWILHEEKEGVYDFDDRLDLGAFIDLCHENDLFFFLRPGPFIMAEMKNEGLPYWIYDKYPDAVPVAFDGEPATTRTLDYLNEGFLAECQKWYRKIMSIAAPRLQCNGGNIIGIQLDNEIGMLNWISNKPILNPSTMNRFVKYLQDHYEPEVLRERYPFSFNESDTVYKALLSPRETYSPQFHFDYGRFIREYYAQYVHILRNYAEEYGIHDTPFFINIHGTGEGRIFDFPLGISQLYQSYNQADGYISGTDVYLGEPTTGKYQDLYVINAYTNCMNTRNQPLTSIEFGCSDAPYCSLNDLRIDATSISHTMMISLAQNARMINFYVFSGGINYPLKNPAPDGNGRMAFTGELHGYNAPVQPDGTHNYAFDHIKDTAKAIAALNPLIASSNQDLSPVSLAFIPDYFLTEAEYAQSSSIKEIYKNLKARRCAYNIDSIPRALLSENIHFDAIDIQQHSLNGRKNLVVLSANYMPESTQRKLVDYVKAGGNLMIYGEIPQYDLEGSPCTIIMDALKLPKPTYAYNEPPKYFLTFEATKTVNSSIPDERGTFAQTFPKDKDAILQLPQSDQMCGFIKNLGLGKVYGITCDYPVNMAFYKQLFQKLGLEPKASADYYRKGIFFSISKGPDGQQLLYIVNLDTVDKVTDIVMDGEVLFKDFYLSSKASYILPRNVRVPDALILSSTAEVSQLQKDVIAFRLSQKQDTILLNTQKDIAPSSDFSVEKIQEGYRITSKKNAKLDNKLTIHFL